MPNLFSWFCLPTAKTEETSNLPKKGEKWRLTEDEEDPWDPVKPSYIKVIDVKDGWVRYYINAVFPDNRRKIDTFVRIYKKL